MNIVKSTSKTLKVNAQTLRSLSRPQHVGNGCSPSPSGRCSVGLPRKSADSRIDVAAKYGSGYDNKALATKVKLTINLKPRVGKLFVITSCVSSPNVKNPMYANNAFVEIQRFKNIGLAILN